MVFPSGKTKIANETSLSKENENVSLQQLHRFLSFLTSTSQMQSKTLASDRSTRRKCRSLDNDGTTDVSQGCFICWNGNGAKATNSKLMTPNRKGRKRKKTKANSTQPVTQQDKEKNAQMLTFVSVDCIGLKLTLEHIKSDLEASSFSIETFLCEQHICMVNKGLELMGELEIIKKIIKESIEHRYSTVLLNDAKCGLNLNPEPHDTPSFIPEVMDYNSEDEMTMENIDAVDFDFCEIDPLSQSTSPQSVGACDDNNVQETDENSELKSNAFHMYPIVKLETTEDLEDTDKTIRLSRRKQRLTNSHLPKKSTKVVDFIDHKDAEAITNLDIKQESEETNYMECPSPSINSDVSYKNDPGESDSDWKEEVEKRKPRRSRSKSNSHKITRKTPKRRRIGLAGEGSPGEGLIKRRRNRTKCTQCAICDMEFRTVEERNAHRLSEHGDGRYFRCNLCTKKYTSIHELRNHIKRVHSTEELAFVCDECPRAYAVWDDLRSHKRRKHAADAKKIITCPYCPNGKKFKGAINLYHHVRVQHGGKPLPTKHLVCEFCGKVYSNPQDFKKHKKKVHLKTYEPSICEICGKSLSDPSSLKKHRYSQHSKAFQYKCELCGSGSLFKSHLIAHYKQSHPSLSVEEFNNLIQSCRKVLDNTNPIYRQDEISPEGKNETTTNNVPKSNINIPSTIDSKRGTPCNEKREQEGIHSSEPEHKRNENSNNDFSELISYLDL